MGKVLDITNQRRGKLMAVSNTGIKSSNGDYKWNFICDCGNTRVMSLGNFKSKNNLACKDYKKQQTAESRKTHGFKNSHKTYKSWCKIRERCFNVNCKDYRDYGAKGITLAPVLWIS